MFILGNGRAAVTVYELQRRLGPLAAPRLLAAAVTLVPRVAADAPPLVGPLGGHVYTRTIAPKEGFVSHACVPINAPVHFL